jgi:heme A synthase
LDTYMVVLRIVHILAGTFWVGAAVVVFGFLQPAAREVGPAASPLMAHLAQKKRLPDIVLGAAGITILAGLLMYWRVTDGLDADRIGSAYGIAITIGALAAIAAVALGASIVRPSMLAAGAIGQEVAASGGPPTPEQSAKIQALQDRVRATGKVIIPLLVFATAAMASASHL